MDVIKAATTHLVVSCVFVLRDMNYMKMENLVLVRDASIIVLHEFYCNCLIFQILMSVHLSLTHVTQMQHAITQLVALLVLALVDMLEMVLSVLVSFMLS